MPFLPIAHLPVVITCHKLSPYLHEHSAGSVPGWFPAAPPLQCCPGLSHSSSVDISPRKREGGRVDSPQQTELLRGLLYSVALRSSIAIIHSSHVLVTIMAGSH